MNKKQRSLVTISCVLFSVTLGGYLGYFLGSIFNAPKVAAQQYIDPVLDDIEATLIKLDKIKAKAGATSLSDIDFTSSSVATDLSISDIVNICINNTYQNPNFRSITIGATDSSAGALGNVHQVINAVYQKNGSCRFIESQSTGMVNVFYRFYCEDIASDSVKVLGGTTIDDIKPVENSPMTIASTEEFGGKSFTSPVIYAISNDTVIPETTIKDTNNSELFTTSIAKNDLGYSIKLALDPAKSGINYAKQIGLMQEMYQNPNFYEIGLEFNVSKDLLIIDKRVHENYTVFPSLTGAANATISKSMEYFKYSDTPFNIFAEKEKIDYNEIIK